MAETIRSIVGCNSKTAAFFLEISGGDVSRAIEMYYEQQLSIDSTKPASTSQPDKTPDRCAVRTPASKKSVKTSSTDPPWIKVEQSLMILIALNVSS